MMAEWRAIRGWEGFYEVSDDGRVRSLARSYVRERNGWTALIRVRERILKAPLCEGYPKVNLVGGGRRERLFVHRLVCEAFHGPAPEGCETAHNNGDRSDPRAENLRWATRRENVHDKRQHGTQPRGEQIWIAKLTEDQARYIAQSREGYRVLARRFSVHPNTVRSIQKGLNWRHLQEVVQ